MNLDQKTRAFWAASYHLRRGVNRDNSTALGVLVRIDSMASGNLKARSQSLLTELKNGYDANTAG